MSSVFCSANTYSKNVFKINKIKPTKTKIKISCSVSNWRERVIFFQFFLDWGFCCNFIGYIVLVVLFVVVVINFINVILYLVTFWTGCVKRYLHWLFSFRCDYCLLLSIYRIFFIIFGFLTKHSILVLINVFCWFFHTNTHICII